MIINPLSFRMSLGERCASLLETAARHGIETLKTPTEAALNEAIQGVMQSPPSRLLVCGGDGTVQALVTALAGLTDAERPELLVLGGGRTNYTAKDLGTHTRAEDWIARAADPQVRWSVSTRHSLILRQAGQPDRHGFFVAAARVNDIIRDVHHYRSEGTGALRRGHLSSAWRLSQIGALKALGRLDYPSRDIHVDAEGLGALSGPIRLLLMTTLEHADEPVRPYADRGQGALRLTATRRDARGFWRRLPRLVRGRYHPGMTPEQGYLSGRCAAVRLIGVDQVCLDGQEHDYSADEPLGVLTGPAFRFIHP